MSSSSTESRATRPPPAATRHWPSRVVLPNPVGASRRHSLACTPCWSSDSRPARRTSPARRAGGRSLLHTSSNPGRPAASAGLGSVSATCCGGSSKVHQATLPPAGSWRTPQALATWSTIRRLRLWSASPLDVRNRSRSGSWPLPATCSREPRSSTRSCSGGRARVTARATSSLASRAAGSASPSSPQRPHLADELPASSGRGGHWLQRQVLSQPGQPAADLGQRLVQAGVHRHPRRHPQLAQDLGHRWPGAAQHQGRARPVKGGVPDGGEHRGAQGVDPLHLAKITDDGRWLLGQVLEDGPLELGRGRQVEPAGEGQHDTALAAGPLDPHRSFPPPSSKTTILTSSQTDEVKGLSRWNGGPDTAGM